MSDLVSIAFIMQYETTRSTFIRSTLYTTYQYVSRTVKRAKIFFAFFLSISRRSRLFRRACCAGSSTKTPFLLALRRPPASAMVLLSPCFRSLARPRSFVRPLSLARSSARAHLNERGKVLIVAFALSSFSLSHYAMTLLIVES